MRKHLVGFWYFLSAYYYTIMLNIIGSTKLKFKKINTSQKVMSRIKWTEIQEGSISWGEGRGKNRALNSEELNWVLKNGVFKQRRVLETSEELFTVER